eukprot:CAMPEP_0117664918 /NCGR_PEP_ID=MMETSP0804-20121206/9502_1 /TAXON_ID=1074897 /ORGANISM="Tetraselmis astigmatica, Strain CCMP880" /LENGTH=79 /DNA_ID=CAMNT_0005472235 /DNA_START=1492 /DNA_END=1731 /DNA_ORIENTATION=-
MPARVGPAVLVDVIPAKKAAGAATAAHTTNKNTARMGTPLRVIALVRSSGAPLQPCVGDRETENRSRQGDPGDSICFDI